MIGSASTALNMLTGGYKPPVGFYFRAGLLEQMMLAKASGAMGAGMSLESKFQEISGISMSLDVEPLIEGGNNDFIHQLPKQAKHDNLILKRGLVTNGSDLASWCYNTMLSGLTRKIIKKGIYVELMSPGSIIPLMFWSFNGAYPVKWEVSSFNSQESAVVVETLEFVYETMYAIPAGVVSL
jgi:phage tail-like protein